MIQDIAPHQLDNSYRADAVPAPGDRVLAVEGQDVACHRVELPGGEAGFSLPRVRDLADGAGELTYLFSLDGEALWLAGEHAAKGLATGFALVSNRELRMERRGPKELMYAVYTAIHLAEWYRVNRHCGCCGARLAHDQELRALRCARCGNLVFPRLNPAIIACVCDPLRERIVLTRYAQGRYAQIDALVAGFVEIGETLEQCVVREVREELGLCVGNIRYYKSQPWGVAGDILAGFWADVEGDTTLHMDERELGRAFWASPEDVTGQPDDLSLTNEMMCLWRDSHLGSRHGDAP